MKLLHVSNLKIAFVATIAALVFSVDANAADAAAAQSLAKQNNCFRCHGIDKDKDGPSWHKIAAKYNGITDGEAKLTYHLTSGEKAKFPDGHEEPHTIIKADDASDIKNLVDWILSL